MTASKFQEHLDGHPPHQLSPTPGPSSARPSSAHASMATSASRFPIDGPDHPHPPRPVNHSRHSSSGRNVLRKLSGGKTTPAHVFSRSQSDTPATLSALSALSPAPSASAAFSGPDADFDFDGRDRAQRIESPESPTSTDQDDGRNKRKMEGSQQQKQVQTQKPGATTNVNTRRRLRKLSGVLSGR